MKHNLTLLSGFLLALASPALRAVDLLLIENGQPRAEIVVAEERPRMVTLVAVELRHFMQKMSGARLPLPAPPSLSFGSFHT